MYDSDDARVRRLKGLRERARDNDLRIALVEGLGGGAELSGLELRAALPDDPALSTVNYHLGILQEAETVGCVGGLYRLD